MQRTTTLAKLVKTKGQGMCLGLFGTRLFGSCLAVPEHVLVLMTVHQGVPLAEASSSSAFRCLIVSAVLMDAAAAPASRRRGTESTLPETQKMSFGLGSGEVAMA